MDELVAKGSPPPMRGKGNAKEIAHLLHGITPAYAGKRLRYFSEYLRLRDHPRLCGEKYFDKPVECEIVGSPPPMRGKVYGDPVHFPNFRITPAYAGKSYLLTNC